MWFIMWRYYHRVWHGIGRMRETASCSKERTLFRFKYRSTIYISIPLWNLWYASVQPDMITPSAGSIISNIWYCMYYVSQNVVQHRVIFRNIFIWEELIGPNNKIAIEPVEMAFWVGLNLSLFMSSRYVISISFSCRYT